MRRCVAVIALLLACAAGPSAEVGVMTLRGKVTAVGKGRAEGQTIVTIEVATGAADEYGLVIGSETKLERATGKRKEPAKASEIKLGMEVEAVCSKVATASNPPLVRVKSIVIPGKKE